jgi:branched-chain amino acid transport system substrate-binding protein
VFDAACERVVAGAAVTLRAPLGGPTGQPVEMLGRISRVRAPGGGAGRIEIQVHVPWSSRLRVHLDVAGAGTRVRLIADLDDSGLQLLMRRRGHPLRDEPRGDDHPVGLLTSKSGPGSVSATATESLAAMAVEEVNAEGGIRGRPRGRRGRLGVVLVADDGRRTHVRPGCDVIGARLDATSGTGTGSGPGAGRTG